MQENSYYGTIVLTHSWFEKKKLARRHPHTAVRSSSYLIIRVFLIIVTHHRGKEERPKNPHTEYRALILRVCPTPEGKRQNPGNKLPLHNSLLRDFHLSKNYVFFITWSLSHMMSPAVPAGCLYWYHNLNVSFWTVTCSLAFLWYCFKLGVDLYSRLAL